MSSPAGSAGFDANGWAVGLVEAVPASRAWTLFSPDQEARVDAERWAHQARTFFQMDLSVPIPKRYPNGTEPLADRVEVDIASTTFGPARVRVVTVPIDRAPELLRAGLAAAKAIGGAGFEAILPRTRRAWQVELEGDPRGPVAIAAVLASLLLAPIVPPEGGAIFGVKGARERLARMG